MKMATQRGLAVVTGAAGGLGSCFANKLAARGYRLLLVDRRPEQLEQVCESITTEHRVSAEAYAADLSNREEVERLAKRLGQMEDVELLVNNAGFGTVDHFVDTHPSLLTGMVDVHIVAPMILTHSVLPGMLSRNSGAIINVSSVSAFFHSAGNAHYGATKIGLAVFSTALHEELRGTNVRVQALCPGFVRTEFHKAESMKGFARCSPTNNLWSTPDDVVDCSLRRLSSKQVIVIPGLGYRIIGRLARMPILQPLMQRIARVERAVPDTAQRQLQLPPPAPPVPPCAQAPLPVEILQTQLLERSEAASEASVER